MVLWIMCLSLSFFPERGDISTGAFSCIVWVIRSTCTGFFSFYLFIVDLNISFTDLCHENDRVRVCISFFLETNLLQAMKEWIYRDCFFVCHSILVQLSTNNVFFCLSYSTLYLCFSSCSFMLLLFFSFFFVHSLSCSLLVLS